MRALAGGGKRTLPQAFTPSAASWQDSRTQAARAAVRRVHVAAQERAATDCGQWWKYPARV